MARRAGWWLMMSFAVFVSGYAITLLFVPAARPPFMRLRFAQWPVAAWLHLALAALTLPAGALQFHSRLRARFMSAHRVIGRVYVVAVLASALGGLALAFVSEGGLVAHFGFGMLAVLWIATTSMAFLRIRAGDVAAHRDWMTRSYALTLAAVTLRILIPLSFMARIPFEQSYPAISWLCWIPNLFVAEWLISRSHRSPAPAAIAAA
jgi:uncharacterized membrane protein